ncbi:hypothetical protein SAMN04487915_11158 [Arthrobacter sp. ov118]|nr:hypothetical protein SAMN04487915_11158 [Arthrobacter sp. ov118]
MYASHERAKRLIIFVHGFLGQTVSTWKEFQHSGRVGQWWREADMLFVGYKSTRVNVASVGHLLIRQLPLFFPTPFPPAMQVKGVAVRDDTMSPYEELILVGHSLGGLVVRCALVEAAQQWHYSPPGTERPILLSAQTRLFSPATAGFRPAGFLGLAEAFGMRGISEMYLRMSSAYLDLQPDSSMIQETQSRTKYFYEKTSEPALQARILWANPDNVVKAEGYMTDLFADSVDGKSHLTVCKPHDGYTRPWQFVESGE